MHRETSFLRPVEKRRYMLLGLVGLLLLWLACLMALGIDPLSHDAQDSYTLQALAWRSGLLHLPQDVPALELAVYEGAYYVSFPPVPTLPLWALSFFYGENTPNRIVDLFYFLSSFLVGYSLCRRLGKTDGAAAVWAVFLVAGCNLLNLCWYGGVWYQAQALAFLLTLCAFRLLLNSSGFSLSMGLFALALSVGCRPFQAVYAIPALWMAYRRLKRQKGAAPLRSVLRLLPLCVPALLTGVGYGLYNLARFHSFFEFGHTYLPEFQRYGTQFSLSYLPQNVKNVLRLPSVEGGRLTFPEFSGSAFYLTNPLFLLAAWAAVRGLVKRRLRALDWMLATCLALHFFLLLLHRTFGGWQFGTRYLIDLCPALFLLSLRHPTKSRFFTGALMLLGILLNLYGGLLFHLT